MFSCLLRRFKAIALVSCVAALMSVPLARADVCTERPAIAAAANDPETNLVFFGSSHVQNGFDPEIFDAAMAEASIDGIHSYNIGWSDEVLAEIIVHVECLFAMRPKNIKYVLFEPNFSAEAFLLPNTQRAIRLFSLHGAYLVNQMMSPYLRLAMGAVTEFDYLRRVLILLVQHYTGLSWPPQEYLPWYAPRGHPHGPRENGSITGDDAYTQRLREIETFRPSPDNVTDAQVRLVLSLANYIRAQGAVPVIVTTPQYNPFLMKDVVAKIAKVCGDRDPLVLDFTSPTKYPALWDPRNRMDDDHLNIRGAGIYSRLLAEELARTLHAPHDPSRYCSF